MTVEILLAQHGGFCPGVRHAVALAERLAADHRQGRVVSLGPLIHNPGEVRRLRAAGVEPVEPEEVREGDRVVIRSHGAPAEVLVRLTGRVAQLEDATCRHVRDLQLAAARLAGEGYAVLLVGDAEHPETEAVLSFARRAAVASSASGAAVSLVTGVAETDSWPGVPRDTPRVAVIAQTTMSLARVSAVVHACVDRFDEVHFCNTICPSSRARQREAQALAARADLVLVIGGRRSANVSRLVELCARIQPRTELLEGADELEARWVHGAARVAVVGGASTPAGDLAQVAASLRQLSETP